MIWWSASPGATKRAQREFEKLSEEMQGRLLAVMGRYFGNESRSEDVTKLDSHNWEWRDHKGNNQFRVLFFVWGTYCVATTAFYKNQRKTPPKDLKRADGRRKTWLSSRGQAPCPGWCED